MNDNKKQYFSVKFPFTANDYEKYFIDLNESSSNYIKSQLMHLIFTPKGTKLRDPLFGTNLIRFIFEPNYEETWNNLKNEISKAVLLNIKNVVLNDINIQQDDKDSSSIYIRIDYSVKDGEKMINDSIITKI